MAGVKKSKASGSTDGKLIKVAATASPGTLIHTAVAGTTSGTYSEVWIWAYNSGTVPRDLTIQFGGTTAPDDHVVVTLPAAKAGLIPVIPGWLLQNGGVVRAFAFAANEVVIKCDVNEITA